MRRPCYRSAWRPRRNSASNSSTLSTLALSVTRLPVRALDGAVSTTGLDQCPPPASTFTATGALLLAAHARSSIAQPSRCAPTVLERPRRAVGRARVHVPISVVPSVMDSVPCIAVRRRRQLGVTASHGRTGGAFHVGQIGCGVAADDVAGRRASASLLRGRRSPTVMLLRPADAWRPPARWRRSSCRCRSACSHRETRP